MPRAEKLSDAEVEARMADVPGWERTGDRISREYTFGSFVEAFGFMASVAILAEKLFHHPERSNVYNRVTIELTTHDVGGLSENDFELAAKIDALLRDG